MSNIAVWTVQQRNIYVVGMLSPVLMLMSAYWLKCSGWIPGRCLQPNEHTLRNWGAAIECHGNGVSPISVVYLCTPFIQLYTICVVLHCLAFYLLFEHLIAHQVHIHVRSE
jgi:hypothetical protein